MSLLQSLSSGLNKTSKLISRSVPAVFYHPNVSIYYFMIEYFDNFDKYIAFIYAINIGSIISIYIYIFDLNL